MAHEKHFIHGIVLEAVPADGTGHDILTRDPATGLVTKISGSPLLTTLPEGQFWIGNSSNIATPVLPSGDVTFNTSGLFDITPGVIVNADISATADIEVSKLESLVSNRLVITDGSGKLTVATVTDTEAGFLSGATSNLQTQLDNKQAIITGAATTITSNNLTANRAVISNASGKVSVSTATSAEVAHLSGVHTPIQTQLDTKLTVSLTTVAQGDLVMFNGSQWVNLGKGTDGQVLTATATSIEWDDSSASGLPTGGTTNQYLKKNSNTNFDTVWDTLELSDITDITASAAELNILTGATLTTTELNFVDGVTSPIQTQLNEKQNRSLGFNNLWVGGASNIAVQLPPGAEDEVLTIVGGSPQWQPVDPPGDVSGPVSSTDNAVARFNGASGDAIDHPATPVLLDDGGNFVFPTGAGLRTGTTATNTLILAAYDVDGASYTTFATLTAGNTPTFDLHTDTTIGSAYPYRVGGTDVSLADGGTGASLSDPGADAVYVWDDTLNQTRLATLDGLTYNSGTNILTATGGGGSGHVIENNGTPLTARNNLNFRGGLSAADNSPDTDALWGGDLIQNVTIDAASTYSVAFDDVTSFSVTGPIATALTIDSSGSKLSAGAGDRYFFADAGSDTIEMVNSGLRFRLQSSGVTLDVGSDIVGDIYYRNALDKLTRLPIGTSGQVLTVSDGLPTWSSAAASYTDEQAQDAVGNIFAPSSTITFNYDDGLPAITASVNTNSITDSLLRTSLGLSVIGRSTSGSGNVADITASSDNTLLRRSGSAIGFGTINPTSGALVMDSGSILGRASGGTGPVQNIEVTNGLSLNSGGTYIGLGGILEASSTVVSVAAGTSFAFTTPSSSVLSVISNVSGSKINIVGSGSSGSAGLSFDIDGIEFNPGVKFTDTRSTTFGIQYTDDYSAGFNSRSIPDVDFVLSYIWEDVDETTYTFVEADKGKIKRFTHPSGCTATISSDLSQGWNVTLYRSAGAGITTIAASGGNTLEATDTTLQSEKTFAVIFRRAANIYAAGGPFGSGVGGGGGVSSVDNSDITGLATAFGGPITGTGVLGYNLNTQNPLTVFMGPTSGSAAQPTFDLLTPFHLPWPSKNESGTTYTVTDADHGTTIYFTSPTGVVVTLGDSIITPNFWFLAVKDKTMTSGNVQFVATGSAILNTVDGEDTIIANNGAASWEYKGSGDWYGWGTLGPGASVGGAHVIENSGTPLTQRDNLDFTNGLTAIDSNPDSVVKLGGTLTESTLINGAQTLTLAVDTITLAGATGASLQYNGGAKGLTFTASATTLNIGSDAQGDIFYKNASNQLTRLPIGTTGQALRVSAGGIPEWGSAASLTASNGLTLASGDVKLGGALTANTAVTGDFNLQFGTSVSNLNQFVVRTDNLTDILSSALVGIGNSGIINYINFSATAGPGSTPRTRWESPVHAFTMDSSQIMFQDKRTGSDQKGITYSGDYSANYTVRSLADWGSILGPKTHTGAQTWRAGSTTAGTAPMYFQNGSLLSSPANGAVEFDGSHLYVTIGSTRHQLDQILDSGIYTPTFISASSVNVGSVTFHQAQYMRVGNVVTLSGQVTIDPTASGAVLVHFTPPIASESTFNTASGVVSKWTGGIVGSVAGVPDPPVHALAIQYESPDGTSQFFMYTCTYEII